MPPIPKPCESFSSSAGTCNKSLTVQGIPIIIVCTVPSYKQSYSTVNCQSYSTSTDTHTIVHAVRVLYRRTVYSTTTTTVLVLYEYSYSKKLIPDIVIGLTD